MVKWNDVCREAQFFADMMQNSILMEFIDDLGFFRYLIYGVSLLIVVGFLFVKPMEAWRDDRSKFLQRKYWNFVAFGTFWLSGFIAAVLLFTGFPFVDLLTFSKTTHLSVLEVSSVNEYDEYVIFNGSEVRSAEITAQGLMEGGTSEYLQEYALSKEILKRISNRDEMMLPQSKVWFVTINYEAVGIINQATSQFYLDY